LELYGCPVEDIGIIRQLPKLRHFTLSQCGSVKDLSPLASCPGVSELILVDCSSNDFSALSYLGEIEYLHMINMDPQKYLPYLNGKTVHQLKIAFSSLASFGNLEGIEDLENRMRGKGRVLIRPSGTEPLVRVMIEGENKQEIERQAVEMAALIESRLA
jgi:phosphomannomutase